MNAENKRIIKVLMFYDIKGWAWWHQINNIALNQPDDIIIDSLQLLADFDYTLYDYIVVFDSFLKNIINKVPKENLIIGCNCPKVFKDFLRDLQLFKPIAGLVNNQTMYNSAKNLYRIFSCPNGVDIDLFVPKKNKINNLTACWVGNAGHFADKGLDKIKNVCEKAKIPLNIFDLSDNKNGLIWPHIELRDRIYYKSDFYICFSEVEGTPNPALEALSCGLPVITTKVGNMPEIIVDGYNGFFTERDETSLFNSIRELEKSDIRTLSLNARNSILNGWSWKNQAKNYTNMFKSLNKELTYS